MTSTLRSWRDPKDTDAMQRLASRCWPHGLHPGGLGWSQATDQLAQDLVLVDGNRDGLRGWAGVTQPGSLVVQVAPDRSDTAAELVSWMVRQAAGPVLTVDTYDETTRQALADRGFERVSPPFGYYEMGHLGLRASVDDVTGVLPPGYSIRAVDAADAYARVEVHRTAWRPADLPLRPDRHSAMDQAWTSSFTLQSYERVQATALYDPGLDLVVVAPDGSLAGCCIGWLDRDTGWAEIEPLGVVPAHRRKGLARALCAEVSRRVARLDGTHVFINTGDSEVYPAPYAAYLKAGFVPFSRAVTLRRKP